jgi:hypothetical protein
MYRQLTSQERDLLCDAFQRFAKARVDLPSLEAASEQYRAELEDAGIVYTSQGFRVIVQRNSPRPNHWETVAVGKPR